MKLTKAQQEVVDLMRDGWELGASGTFGTRRWLQKNGIGKGGEVRRVHASTFASLFQSKIIVMEKPGIPISTYKLATHTAPVGA